MTNHAAFTIDFDTLARDLFRPALDVDAFRQLEDVSYRRVLPRLLDWLDAAQIRATFFVIGRHALVYAQPLAEIAARGHEIANHSFHHHRHFASLDRHTIAEEIARAGDALAVIAGRAPVGFRAPGYTIRPEVIDVLEDLGYAYDASLVPSWFYSTTKHMYRLFAGRDYREYLHPQSVWCAAAPKQPYRIAASSLFRASAPARLLEIPQTTVGPLQFPLIYGLLARLWPGPRRIVEALAARQPLITIGFHDLEFAAAEDVGALPVGELTRPHIARPVDERLASLTALVARIRRTHAFVTLAEVAAAYQPSQSACS